MVGIKGVIQLPELIFAKIKPVLEKQFIFEGELTLKTRFLEDLGADSLDIVQLLSDLEDMFDIKMPPEDLVNIQTVGDIVDYIARHTSPA
jgi:acyl carrier protein